MTGDERPGAAAAEPLDERDAAVLGDLRDLYGVLDPVPADLVDRVRFTLALDDLDVEVIRLREETGLDLAGVRGDEESRTITFDSDSLTVMISILPLGRDEVRLDGWLAPPAAHRVELRSAHGDFATDADDEGRFVIDRVPC